MIVNSEHHLEDVKKQPLRSNTLAITSIQLISQRALTVQVTDFMCLLVDIYNSIWESACFWLKVPSGLVHVS